ncbi:CPBP family intramembrane glutamic endopeptidase [Halovulum sp. GXIMD14793]
MLTFRQYAALAATHLPNTQSWRIGAGVVLFAVCYFAASTLAYLVLLTPQEMSAVQTGAPATPRITLMLLLPFPLVLLLFALELRPLHHVGFRRLAALRPTRFVRSLVIGVAVVLLPIAFLWLLPGDGSPLSQQTPLNIWLRLVTPALGLLLLQTLCEEFIFRGYLQGYLAARFASPLIWWILPSTLFAMLHYSPEMYGEAAWLAVIAVLVMGLLLADITARTGSIAIAWGVHLGNNVVSVLWIAVPGPLSGLSLFLDDIDPSSGPEMQAAILMSLIQVLILYALYQIFVFWRVRRNRGLQNPPRASI